MKLYIIAGMN